MDRWTYVFDSLPDLIILFDRTGRVERANSAAVRVLSEGSESAIVGRGCDAVVHDVLVPATSCPVCRVRHSREPVEWSGIAPGLDVGYKLTALPGSDDPKANGVVLFARRCLDANGMQANDMVDVLVPEGVLRGIDAVEVPIQIIDLSSYEVLWANDLRKRQSGHDIVGRPCYEALERRDEPCPWCRNDELVVDGKISRGTSCEQRDGLTGDRYLHVNRAFEWPDGRLVKLEMVVDLFDKEAPCSSEKSAK